MAAQARSGRVPKRVRNPDARLGPGDPPRCPSGWAIGPPDFVGVGAQRAGTSRWYDLIVTHPQVGHGPKELHYFDDLRWSASLDVSTYREFFPRPPGEIRGEWTPVYMAMPWVPPLLAKIAPETRLLVSLRDPIERHLSGLRHRMSMMRLRPGARRQSADPPRWSRTDATYRSLYAAQLEHLRRYFAPSQILILQFERCVLDPEAELRRTYEFLGVDPDWTPKVAARKVNKGRASVDMSDGERRALVAFIESDVRRLVTDYPEIDLALWSNFAHLG
jgi:Sulfotransferase family